MTRTTWEYYVAFFPVSPFEGDFGAKMLQDFGQKGWELVSVVLVSECMLWFYLKRERVN